MGALGAVQHFGMLDIEAAHINPVEPEPGQRGREGARGYQTLVAPGDIAHQLAELRAALEFVEHLHHAQFEAQAVGQGIAPVVEVARDDDRLAVRGRILHGTDQGIGLASAAALEQPQVHDIAMHVADRRFQHAVQDAALFVGMVGNVVVARVGDRVGRQQRVAVVAVVVDRVHAVRGMQRFTGKELVLGFFRPVVMGTAQLFGIARLVTVMAALDFLQEHDVCLEQADGFLQRQYAWRTAERRHALVDVVSRNTNFHGNILTPSVRVLPTMRQSCGVSPVGAGDGVKNQTLIAGRKPSAAGGRVSTGNGSR
jgi:hypothetical protein